MIFPFDSLLTEYRELGLVVAVLIGFGFGFVLERAGFGRASKLAAQFYGHDMTVFKVMFGAIVTAMLGVVVASNLGLVDLKSLSESAVTPTFVWPMLIGGLALGAGFIISGYCPGTAVVATASGNLDGLFAFGGVIVGSLLFSWMFPLFEGFYLSGAQGYVFLYEMLGLSPAVVAAMVTAMALGCFWGAEKLEAIFTRRKTGETIEHAPKRLAWSSVGVVAVVGLATLLYPVAQAAPTPKQAESMQPDELARRVLDAPWKQRILDLRGEENCAKLRVPGSECTPMKSLAELGLAYSPMVQDLVLIPDADLPELPEAAAAFPGRIFVLKGGFPAWKAYALTPPAPPGEQAQAADYEAFKFRSAVHRSLTGKKAAPPPPRKAIKYVPKKRKKTGGCG